ncbi:MAG: CvpA family protein [Actinobacteria bacterium]|nr:CvpA family protein [Actinomycetota bacterium]
MVIDVILVLIAVSAVFTGFRRGFLQTLLTTLGYIGGGVLGLALSLHFASQVHSNVNRIGAVILSIFLMAEIGRRVFGLLAKYFRTRILWSPLKFLDSLAGVVLELVRAILISFLIISVLLWSPWTPVRSAVRESTIYPKIAKQLPTPIKQLRSEIEKRLSISLP